MRNDKRHSLMKAKFSTLKYISYISLAISLISLIAIMVYIFANGFEALSFNLLFGEYQSGSPSIFPAIKGTLQLIFISVVIAVPLGIFTAIFLTEYTNNKSKFVKCIRVATETLAGIPSIVYGLFGYLVFVRAMGLGYSLLGGGLTLAIMILPTIVRSTEESILSIPSGLREGSFALGASKVSTIFKIVLPSASSGIVTAIILSIGRVVSESAVLILTVGMVVDVVPVSVLSPGTSLALDIYYFSSNGYPKEASATALFLIIFVLLINVFANFMGKLLNKNKGVK